jgi:hypothetical protein
MLELHAMLITLQYELKNARLQTPHVSHFLNPRLAPAHSVHIKAKTQKSWQTT